VTTSGYFADMGTVSIKEAKSRLTALAREVENGETIVVTRTPCQRRKLLGTACLRQ
jgi:hypothetical protein